MNNLKQFAKICQHVLFTYLYICHQSINEMFQHEKHEINSYWVGTGVYKTEIKLSKSRESNVTRFTLWWDPTEQSLGLKYIKLTRKPNP